MSGGIPIDQCDIDRIIDIHEDNVGDSDEELAARVDKYLKSDRRRYRRAKDRPKPRLVWDADA